MADHHISYDPKTSEDIEQWLISHGMHIAGAPDVVHKPGNVVLDDVWYPFPPYPDNRFTSTNNDIKDKGSNSGSGSLSSTDLDGDGDHDIYDELFGFFEIPDSEMDMASHDTSGAIHIINHDQETTTMFKDKVYPYTGLTIAAIERKAYNIAFVKNKQVHIREVTTGRMYSIATFDGAKFHIYRGICKDIQEYDTKNWNTKKSNNSSNLDNMSSLYGTPYNVKPSTNASCTAINSSGNPYQNSTTKAVDKSGNPYKSQMASYDLTEKSWIDSEIPITDANGIICNPKQVTKRNMVIVLDTSEFLNSSVEVIPVNQIIDIEFYNYNYDFTIYEVDLKIYLTDWFESIENNDEDSTAMNVPHGDRGVQTIHYPVVEHQRRKYMK